VTLNEGGYFMTFYWNRDIRMVRFWFKPNFWKAGRALFERVWKY
jgi:hypothetical protein